MQRVPHQPAFVDQAHLGQQPLRRRVLEVAHRIDASHPGLRERVRQHQAQAQVVRQWVMPRAALRQQAQQAHRPGLAMRHQQPGSGDLHQPTDLVPDELTTGLGEVAVRPVSQPAVQQGVGRPARVGKLGVAGPGARKRPWVSCSCRSKRARFVLAVG